MLNGNGSERLKATERGPGDTRVSAGVRGVGAGVEVGVSLKPVHVLLGHVVKYRTRRGWEGGMVPRYRKKNIVRLDEQEQCKVLTSSAHKPLIFHLLCGISLDAANQTESMRRNKPILF